MPYVQDLLFDKYEIKSNKKYRIKNILKNIKSQLYNTFLIKQKNTNEKKAIIKKLFYKYIILLLI